MLIGFIKNEKILNLYQTKPDYSVFKFFLNQPSEMHNNFIRTCHLKQINYVLRFRWIKLITYTNSESLYCVYWEVQTFMYKCITCCYFEDNSVELKYLIKTRIYAFFVWNQRNIILKVMKCFHWHFKFGLSSVGIKV